MSEGRDPVFHCYASGWPKPSFTWLKDGVKIKDGDALHSYVLTERAQGLDSGLDLDILYARPEHAGQYSCVARNRFGVEQHDINLFLQSKYPYPPDSCVVPLPSTSARCHFSPVDSRSRRRLRVGGQVTRSRSIIYLSQAVLS